MFITHYDYPEDLTKDQIQVIHERLQYVLDTHITRVLLGSKEHTFKGVINESYGSWISNMELFVKWHIISEYAAKAFIQFDHFNRRDDIKSGDPDITRIFED